MWLLSRLIIVVSMQLIAPIYPYPPTDFGKLPIPLDFVPGYLPKMGWELFSHWDGAWYEKVVTQGYDYGNDGKWHSVAFFPIFPLLIRGVMYLGLPFEVAGVLVNNLAFLGALLLVYRWVEEHHDINAARWATAVLAWCPLSLYGTVIYTEGLFLLVSTAALRSFEKGQYAWAAFWGAMTTATRVTGAAIAPAFLLVAWREKRPAIAYATAFATGVGLLAYMVYCGIRFGDPVAFVTVQRAWSTSPGGINWQGWLGLFTQMLTSRFEAVNSLTKLLMFFGGGYLLWYLRTKLSRVAVTYGFCALGLLLISGSVISLTRHVYGIVSISIALGLLLSRHPRWGYALMGLFSIFLIKSAIRFCWWLWVA